MRPFLTFSSSALQIIDALTPAYRTSGRRAPISARRAPIVVTTWLTALLLLALAPASLATVYNHRDVNVLVLNYDPLVPNTQNAPSLSDLFFNDPQQLAAGYEAQIEGASGGYIQYNVVDWVDIDAFPTKIDGYAYDFYDWYGRWTNNPKGPWHTPDLADYDKMMTDNNVYSRVNSGEVDEVWVFGAPYMGYYESRMIGPSPFWVNAPAITTNKADRNFVVMGFNYERGVAEMVHNLGHRTEDSVKRAYGDNWNITFPQDAWDRFTANVTQTSATYVGGVYGVGSVHYPANGASDYDYNNAQDVLSNWAQWENFPNVNYSVGQVTDNQTWLTTGDAQLDYLRWWFENLPDNPGFGTDGRTNNWWEYIYAYDQYARFNGLPLYDTSIPTPGTPAVLLATAPLLLQRRRR